MLIILEGVDCSGKTTLADAITKKLGVRTIRLASGPPMRSVLLEYVNRLTDSYRPGAGIDIVADRWHWGELVYGPLLRNRSAIDEAQLDYIDHTLNKLGAVLAYLAPPKALVLQRLKERGDTLIRPVLIPDIMSGYARVRTTTTVKNVVDFSHNDSRTTESKARILVQQAAQAEAQACR